MEEFVGALSAALALPVLGQTVKVTTLGGIDGEFCPPDPDEAAYVINDLVKPASAIASRANEVGAVNGKVRPGSKTEAFIKAVKVPVPIPLSGKPLEFDGAGKCTARC